MGKNKNKIRYDADGARRVMRKRDYLADMTGQIGLGLIANMIGQLTYFYTDKVGLAVGGVGIVMMIAKIIDAFTDVIVGNIIDHSKGGNKKYYSLMMKLAAPAAVIVTLMFTVPVKAGQIPALLYVLITNILLTAVVYTVIGTPYGVVMIIRSNSQSERSTIGLFRAIANYGSGMIIAIATIPVTNMLGGTQSAWIKYGFVIALIVFLMITICWNNGRKAKFASEFDAEEKPAQVQDEEEAVPFNKAIDMLFHNKYWIIVLLFNVIMCITTSISASAGTYYCKWIFGNDNLVGILGAFGMLATVVGFVIAKPIISLLGIKRTIYLGTLGAAVMAAIRCVAPTNFVVYALTGAMGNFLQIPLMCLYGVLTGMAVDYNKWKYDKRMIAMSASVIGVGNKVGTGLGAVILTAALSLGAYDATLEAASASMRTSIYGFSNYLPIVINIIVFLIFTRFDLEEKLPQMRADIEARRIAKSKAEE